MVQVDLRTPGLGSGGLGGGRGLGGRLFGRSGMGMGGDVTGGSGGTRGPRQGGDDPLSTLLLRGIERGSGLPPSASTTSTSNTRSRGRSGTAASVRPTTTTSTTTGSTNNNAATTTTPAASGRVITRGGRRWGRTGSQRSTRTLPLYSEDVGEEDVVLIRWVVGLVSIRFVRE